MSYVVKWGRERLTFPLPSPDTKLAFIRKQIADYTQLPPNSFKLVHAGAVMKDDNAPISAYGIRPSSTIAVVGGGDNSIPDQRSSKIPANTKAPRTEESTIAQIRSEMDTVRRNLQPDVDTFLNTLQPSQTASGAPPQSRGSASNSRGNGAWPARSENPEKEHARLGEMLLQSLLRLDAINAEGEWEQARSERKGAVKEVQGLLDKLDVGWKSRNRN
ncbi:hypothetical protein K474DRAFT_1700380 [Panus rudis PR-1116 ss-1]|nr:hypothetical protein K474DRAFT_1700380 [Panus rudis PR-1116 ss-1]